MTGMADKAATTEEAEQIARTESLFRDVRHEDERVEGVVETDGELAVVEKRHPLVEPLVRALDPRPV